MAGWDDGFAAQATQEALPTGWADSADRCIEALIQVRPAAN